MCSGAAPDHHGHLARVKVELLASTYCVAGCALMEKNKLVAEIAEKVMKKLKEEVEKKGLEWSVTENGKEGKNKMIVSCGFLKDEMLQCSKE